MRTRVRFAPSPTGPLHIGGVRTALFNYLYARKERGSFILRVEDTDQNRYVDGSEDYIQEALEWCGMHPDEGPKNGGEYGPYRQSERKEIYDEYIKLLIEKGGAYYAFDSNDALSDARETAEKNGESFKYGAKNRMFFKNSLTIGKDEVELALKEEYVVRLKVEAGETVNIYDEIRGIVQVNTNELDDKILMKSDGMPTYHFANVVDDHLMEISCVIRGEEWLPSLPLHKLIYDAFGWDTPKFMHLPLILKPTGKGKLSKRDGDKGGFPVFPLNWGEDTPGFREKGFLAEGMINYLALLGWNDGTENEFFSLKDLETKFSVTGIQKGGARFDYEKARWVNHHKIIEMNTEELTTQSQIAKLMEDYPIEKHKPLVNLVKARMYTLKDLEEEIAFVEKTYPYDEKVLNKLKDKNPIVILNKIKKTIEKETPNLKESLMNWAKEESIPMGALMQSFRIALVGQLRGPDLFEICNVLGKEVSLIRIENLIQHINLKLT